MKTCTTCGKEFPDETKFCPDDGSTLRTAAGTADMIGSIIADRYHVTKKLGEGGMGAVYLGEHVKMGRKSAIKVMVSSMANDPDAVARFNREAANAARINHHNVCGIYDFGETDEGVIYLAMEYIEGEALTATLEREGALSAAKATDLLGQCTDALQAAHDLNIVHRDIKPDNIMVSKGRGGKDLIKVVDFGIAKAVGGEEGQNVTKTGLVVGTPEYMSPEQLSGDKLDGRSDIYSIALVYFRMLTGTLPFQADTAQEVMIKRLTDDPVPLAQAYPAGNFSANLQAVMDKGLARIPSDRYSTAIEFGEAAAAAVSAVPASATPAPGDPDGATQLIDSSSLADVTEEVIATASPPPKDDALAATRITASSEPTPDTPRPAVSPAVAGKKSPVVAIAATLALAVGGTAAFMMMNSGDELPTDTQPVAVVTPGTQQTELLNVTGNTENGAGQANNDGRNIATTPSRNAGRQPENNGRDSNGGNDATRSDPQPVELVTRTAPDLASISERLDTFDTEIFEMFTPVPRRLSEIRSDLRAVYDDDILPDSLRFKAAQLTVDTYAAEENTNGICNWIDNALSVDPTKQDQFTRTQDAMGC